MDCNGPTLSVANTNAAIAKSMVDNWFTYDGCHSWGHRKNILGSSFTNTGIGVTQGSSGYWYACQDFAG